MADKNKSKELMFQIRFELSDLDAKGMNLDSPKGNSRAIISILSSCNSFLFFEESRGKYSIQSSGLSLVQ